MADWQAIRTEYEQGASLRQLAVRYGVGKSTIAERKYKEQWERTADSGQRTVHANTGTRTRNVLAAVRVQAAIKIFLEERPTWDEIAARAGYASRGGAHDAVMRELDRCITHDVTELRTQELYMLSQLQARCYKACLDEKNKDWTWAVDRFVSVSKRKSELMGLDIPVDNALTANIVVIREIPNGYIASEVNSG